MTTLHVAGRQVGTLADAEKLIPELLAQNERVELRDNGGKSIGTVAPKEPLVPWDPSITEEEMQRRLAGEFVTFEEMKKRLGWE